jgi:hypothetical protein
MMRLAGKASGGHPTWPTWLLLNVPAFPFNNIISPLVPSSANTLISFVCGLPLSISIFCLSLPGTSSFQELAKVHHLLDDFDLKSASFLLAPDRETLQDTFFVWQEQD